MSEKRIINSSEVFHKLRQLDLFLDELKESISEAGVNWGEISGTLADQEDLQDILNAKLESSDISNLFDKTSDTMDNITNGSTYVKTENNFTDTEKSKLAGIEAGADVNPSASEVKTLYESNADTNAYTDTEKTKLANIEENANNYSLPGNVAVTDADNEFTDTQTVKTDTEGEGFYLTKTDGTVLAYIRKYGESALMKFFYGATEIMRFDGRVIDGRTCAAFNYGVAIGTTGVSTGEKLKVAGLANIQSLKINGTDTVVFSSAEKTKLSGIEENANKYILPSDVVQDADYVHTDNNYTTTEKNKLASISNDSFKIANLHDVDLADIADGDILVWNNTDSEFKNEKPKTNESLNPLALTKTINVRREYGKTYIPVTVGANTYRASAFFSLQQRAILEELVKYNCTVVSAGSFNVYVLKKDGTTWSLEETVSISTDPSVSMGTTFSTQLAADTIYALALDVPTLANEIYDIDILARLIENT